MSQDHLAAAAALFERTPFMMKLGVRVTGAGHGWVEAELSLQPWMHQQDGFSHAGVGASLADHAMGTAAFLCMVPGETPLSVELSVRMLRPGDGERLRCRAEVVKPGRRLTVVEADVWTVRADGTEKHIMRGLSTMAVVKTEELAR
jgi:uncharacterized protein (TIGR00369 family)